MRSVTRGNRAVARVRRETPVKKVRPGFALACVVTSIALVAQSSSGELIMSPRSDAPDTKQLRAAADKVRPLHAAFKPGDWARRHPEETGQTFAQYLASNPNRPSESRNKIYILPIGERTKTQQQVVDATIELLGRWYGVPVKSLPAVPLDAIPASARRVHPSWGDKQILTSYVRDEVLKPRRPADAVAVLGLTTSDLWPGPGWNFVFGEASLTERVGVWSLYRYGDPDKSPADFTSYLRRTLKVATHETGHMFGIPHCTSYECGMNGSNSLRETDERPTAFCPECAPKIWWATGAEPARWYGLLAEFAGRHGLNAEAELWRACQERLNAKQTGVK